MAAAAATSSAIKSALSTPSLSPPSSSLNPNASRSSLGFISSSSSTLKPLVSRVYTRKNAPSNGRSSLSVNMVSVPSITPTTSLDFDTSVFKKEKVTLAGHDEVYIKTQILYPYRFWSLI